MNNELNDQNFLRYQRQIALNDIGESGQLVLLNSHILIIGCGGLGCAASTYLAAAGIGRLVICDSDSVEISNLPRQLAYRESDLGKSKVEALAEQIKAINHACRVRTIGKRMDDQQLAMEVLLADIVLDCSDNFATRLQLNRVCYGQRRTLISGAAIGWKGQFAAYQYSCDSACYQCLVSPAQLPDEATVRCSDAGVVGAVVGTIGCMQAASAIAHITNPLARAKPTELVQFDGKAMSFTTMTIAKDCTCAICSTVINAPQEKELINED